MAGDKRERILKAATKIFAKKGFYNAKVTEIAKKAHVADGTIYLYFESKDDLLIALFDEQMVPIIKRIRRGVKKETTAIDKLRRFIFLHLDMVERNQDLAMVLVVELRQSAKFMHDYPGTKFKEYLQVISDIIIEGQAGGEIPKSINPSISKQVIFGALDDVATNWLVSKNKSIKLTDFAGEIEKILLIGVTAK